MKSEVVIVGGGPGGAATALHLLERGLKPLIVEKEAFPRYHIGESLTGECGACLKRAGLEDFLVKERFPVKHGVKVYGTGGRNAFWVQVQQRLPDGRLKPQTTWSLRRSAFDEALLDLAVRRGARHLRGEDCLARRSQWEFGCVCGLL